MAKIIKANISHLDEVYEIVRNSSDWMQKEYQFNHWDNWYTRDRIRENFLHGDVYVLLENNIPVATYTIKKYQPSYYSNDDMNKFSSPNELAYYCYTLAVHPEKHGNGYAKMLLSHLEQIAKKNNIKFLRFDARADYSQLIEFYTKYGFKIVGELNDEGDKYYLFEKEIF